MEEGNYNTWYIYSSVVLHKQHCNSGSAVARVLFVSNTALQTVKQVDAQAIDYIR